MSKRVILSAKQLYFFHQKNQLDDANEFNDSKDEREENKSYVLGYN